MTVNDAVVVSPVLPLKVIVAGPPAAVELTVKLQPTILPPETVQVCGEGESMVAVKETDVSAEAQPVPVTVTLVPVGPE